MLGLFYLFILIKPVVAKKTRSIQNGYRHDAILSRSAGRRWRQVGVGIDALFSDISSNSAGDHFLLRVYM